MPVYNPYKAYANNSVASSSPEELTLMLYDGALKFGNLALVAIEKRDINAAHNNIMRVEDIILEFRATLDKKYDISKQFDVMYDYIYRRLVEANLKKDATILKECLDLIRQFRDTWKEAMIISRQQRGRIMTNK